MTQVKTYNGHKNRNHWNVSLWINNDQTLHAMAKSFKKQFTTARYAAKVMLRHLPAKTPDGCAYSISALSKAIASLEA